MNHLGWANMQTSGENLFGTLTGSMYFNFTLPVNNLVFDVINGTGPGRFTVNFYGASQALILQTVFGLTGFTQPGSVQNVIPGVNGIARVEILGTNDFAVDTISFNGSAVPEPATFALVGGAMAALALARARRKS
jgi:hypothetical protein